MAATQRYMDGVRDDQWHAPTPNTEWDVKQVANHIIGENLWAGELLHRKTIAEVGNKFDGDLAGLDPAAAHQDTRLRPDLLQACIPIARQITAMARSTRVYGDDLPVSPDADQQTKLLALVGRRA